MYLLHRKRKEQVSCSLNSAKTAKRQMQLYKLQIVRSMKAEYKEMMRQALDEVSVLIRWFVVLIQLPTTAHYYLTLS